MRTVELKIYSYKELSEQVREKVRERHRHYQVENDYWYEAVCEEFIDEFRKAGFMVESDDIRFSLFHQGAGASIDKKTELNVSQMWDFYVQSSEKKGTLIPHAGMIGDIIDCCGWVTWVEYTTYYVHERSCCLTWQKQNGDIPRLAKVFDEFMDFMEVFRLKLCRELESALEKEYMYLTSDEAVDMSLEAFEFFENGDLYNG